MQSRYRQRADRLAPVMFGLSFLFVVLLGALIVVWVDIPRVAELSVLSELEAIGTGVAGEDEAPETIQQLVKQRSMVLLTDPIGKMMQMVLLVLWPLFWLEYLASLLQLPREQQRVGGGYIRLLACAIPPLRIAAPSASHDGKIWLPKLGWREPGKNLARQLERAFGKPMLFIAFLILPILLIEYGLHALVEDKSWLRVALHLSTGFIWCAFTVEFLIMISATDKRLFYVRTHWIDLVIILLPLVSFLRSFRVLRLTKLAKVQKLAKMGRVFRVRGLMMKVLRALMMLGFVNRLLRITPEKRLQKLREDHAEQLEDLQELEAEIEALAAQIADDARQTGVSDTASS
ncbi:MAG: ion transporter [Rhodothermales bacterium]|nr:ion transporter [Rhodothermales bacterium]